MKIRLGDLRKLIIKEFGLGRIYIDNMGMGGSGRSSGIDNGVKPPPGLGDAEAQEEEHGEEEEREEGLSQHAAEHD